jgi:hypothetical protein
MLQFLTLTALVALSLSQPDGWGGGGGGSSNGGVCTKQSSDFLHESADFLNCIGDKLQGELNHFKTNANPTPAQYVQNKERELEGYFSARGVQCDAPDLGMDLVAFMERVGVPPIIRNDITANLRIIIWEAAKSEDLSRCFLEYLRDEFLQYIGQCTGSNVPHDNTLLNRMPVPNGINYDLKASQDHLELLIKAYLSVGDCKTKGRKGWKNVVKKMNAQAETDVCQCQKAEFRDCSKQANVLCQPVQQCIQNLIKKPEAVFNGEEVYNRAKSCYDRYKGSVKISNLAQPGLALYKAFKDLKANENNSNYKQFGKVVEAIVSAHFQASYCERCK